MANRWYGKAREAAANAQWAWLTDTIKAVLIDTALYTVAIDVDEFLASVPAGARVGTPQTLANKANVLGVLDADNVAFGAVTGPTLEALVLYKDTGVEGTSRLLLYIDTATGLPTVALSTIPVSVAWDDGATKIAKL
jgi:hypothetical protein